MTRVQTNARFMLTFKKHSLDMSDDEQKASLGEALNHKNETNANANTTHVQTNARWTPTFKRRSLVFANVLT